MEGKGETQLLLAFYGDDFTGLTDALEALPSSCPVQSSCYTYEWGGFTKPFTKATRS
ncbi:hypothetical protein [Neobacillus cucumis]|uniref:hypothetical protein n=1 Tax=Neobacillus cucumis TaxID=1740721 RepID=UPI002155C50A|nr:hypothetical protein [Neobacillus cucumis]